MRLAQIGDSDAARVVWVAALKAVPKLVDLDGDAADSAAAILRGAIARYERRDMQSRRAGEWQWTYWQRDGGILDPSELALLAALCGVKRDYGGRPRGRFPLVRLPVRRRYRRHFDVP